MKLCRKFAGNHSDHEECHTFIRILKNYTAGKDHCAAAVLPVNFSHNLNLNDKAFKRKMNYGLTHKICVFSLTKSNFKGF